MIRRIAFVAFAGAIVAAVPARAQDAHAGHGAAQGGTPMCPMMSGMQHGAGGMPGMQHGAGGMHEQGMMGGYASNPAMLLHHQADLGLTPDQVTRIEALVKSAQDECAQHMKLAHEQHAAANAALQAQTPNLAGFEARLREASQHMVQAHVAMARRGVEALDVLTAAQRAKLQTKHEAHGSGHSGH